MFAHGHPTSHTVLVILFRVQSNARLRLTISLSGTSVEDLPSQFWSAEIEEQGRSLRTRYRSMVQGSNGRTAVARHFADVLVRVQANLRNDKEPAQQDLLKQIARLRGDLPTVLDGSPVVKSQSNGFVEAVWSTAKMIKIAIEVRLAEKVNSTHPAIGWLTEYHADILNKCYVGRTPSERLKSKKFGGTFLEFGNLVMLPVTDKLQGGLVQERWMHVAGVQVQFLGTYCITEIGKCRGAHSPLSGSALTSSKNRLLASVGNATIRASTFRSSFLLFRDSSRCRVYITKVMLVKE